MATEENVNHALFADHLDPNDPTVQALMSIQKESLKDTLTTMNHWREIGNDHFQESKRFPDRVRDARNAYTEAIEVYQQFLRGSAWTVDDESLASENQGPGNDARKQVAAAAAKLYLNLALCYSRLKQDPQALSNCKKAAAIDPYYTKAFVIAARTAHRLGFNREVSEHGRRAAELADGDEEIVREMKHLAAVAESKLQERERASKAVKFQEQRQRVALEAAMKYREIEFSTSPRAEVAHLPLGDPFVDLETGIVSWPIVVIFEELRLVEGIDHHDESIPILPQLLKMRPDLNIENTRLFLREGLPADESCRVECDPNAPLADSVNRLRSINRWLILSVELRSAEKAL